MAGELKLVYDFSKLDECVNKMESLIRDTCEISQNLILIRKHIDRKWDGAADRAYGERCISILEKISKLNEEMCGNRDKLIKAVDKYRTNEDTQVRNVNRLSDEDIF